MTERSKSDDVAAGQRMFELLWPGALAAQAIYCAAKLKLGDVLAEGPRRVEEIARETGSEPGPLRRLLRALCSLDVLFEGEDGTFGATPLGATLQDGDPSGVRPWAIMLGAPFIWKPWGDLLESVKTGEPAFGRVFDGQGFYEYGAEHPEALEEYNAAMNAGASMMVAAAVRAYDFSRFATIVDVGGGRGALLRGILEAYEGPRGVLFDRPSVVETATELRQSAVAERCEIVGGDFFDDVPPGDAHLLKGILHGFTDENAVRILQNVRRAIGPGGRLLVLDTVLSERNEPEPQKAMMDLMMLALAEGHERTEADFARIFTLAGFTLSRVIETERGGSIVEGEPV